MSRGVWRTDLGERIGYVNDVSADCLRVGLDTENGLRHYKFPAKISPVPLEPNDWITLYFVDGKAGLELRLEKREPEPLTPEQISRLDRWDAYELNRLATKLKRPLTDEQRSSLEKQCGKTFEELEKEFGQGE